MPVLSEETSMICLLWLDADNNASIEERPGTRQCLGMTHVEHTLKYSSELHGKPKHRICLKCNHVRDSIESWTGTFFKKRIDAAKGDDSPRLFNPEDYCVNNANESRIEQ